MKKILSFILMTIFALSIVGITYAEEKEICPDPTRPLCTGGQVVGWFRDDNDCRMMRCEDPAPTTCVTTEDGSCCIGGVCNTTINSCSQGFMVNFFGCDDTCTPRFECLLNTTKNCIMEGYQTQDTNPDVSCCAGLVPITSPELVGRATCVKDTSSNSTCIAKDNTCCLGSICKTAVKDCTQGLTHKFLGCSDSCTPISDCVDASGIIINPTTTTNCVTEGNSHSLIITTNSAAVSCCEGLVVYTRPDNAGVATCVKPGTTGGDKPVVSVQPSTPTVTTTAIAATNQTVNTEITGKETIEKPTVKGLENAILKVNNNETKAHLEEVFAKIQDKRKEQLAKLENMEISKDEKTNKTIIKGEGKAKFLGFISINKNYEYEVDEQGNVQKHKKAFDFLFKKEDPIDQTT